MTDDMRANLNPVVSVTLQHSCVLHCHWFCWTPSQNLSLVPVQVVLDTHVVEVAVGMCEKACCSSAGMSSCSVADGCR